MSPHRSKRPLVWLAEVPLHGVPHRQAHLAKLISDRFDVVYVEPPPPLHAPRLMVSSESGVHVAQFAPLLNAHPLRRLLTARVVKRLATRLALLQLRVVLARGFGYRKISESVVVCSNVYAGAAATLLKPYLFVSDICDDPRHYPGEPPWVDDLLTATLRRSDLIVTSSRALQAEFAQLAGRSVELLSNGVHAEFLRNDRATHPPPNNGPAGFVGYFGSWVDIALLDQLADALPELELRIVGAVDRATRDAAQHLARRSNVVFTGAVPERDIPGMLAELSVGLIPFRRNPYTYAVNPNKLYEYAAWNLPIVATDFSPDVSRFSPDVDVCQDTAQYIATVRQRAVGRGRRSTRWIAEANTWPAIAHQFELLIETAASQL